MFSYFKQYRQQYAATLKLAIPLVATLWAQMGLGMIDTVMLGKLGTEELAAGGLGVAIFVVLFVPMVGFISAVGIFIARAYGRRDYPDAVNSFQQGIWLAIFLAVPMTLIMWSAPYALIPLGYTPTLAVHATDYLHMIMFAAFPSLLIVTQREFIAAFGMPKLLFYTSLSAMPLNVLGNYVLMYGMWGFPEMGAAGIGLATALSDVYLSALLFFVIFKHRAFNDLKVFDKVVWPRKAFFKELFYLGLPISMSIGIEICLFTGTTFMMGLLDPVALAGHQVAVNITPFVFMLPYGLSQATAIQTGHAMGAGEPHRVRAIGISTFHIGLVAATITMLIYTFAGRQVVGCFLDLSNPDYAESITYAVGFLYIGALLLWSDSINVISQGGLRGLKDTKAPMMVLFYCHWCIGLPLAAFLAFGTPIGPNGIWMGLVTAVVLASIFNTRRFLKTSSALLQKS